MHKNGMADLFVRLKNAKPFKRQVIYRNKRYSMWPEYKVCLNGSEFSSHFYVKIKKKS